jgi:hypothetical protein
VQQFVAQTAADRDAEARRVDQLNLEIDADFLRYPNSPDETAPAWKLAALVTPPGFTAGRCCAVTVTVTVARFESGPPLDEA